MIKEIDIKTLNRLIKNDDEAFREMYYNYVDSVGKFFHRNGVKKIDMQDLVIEVFCKVLQKLKYYNPNRGNFEAFILMVAKYELLDYFRSGNKLTESFEYLELNSPYWGAVYNDTNLVSILRDMKDRLTPVEHDVILFKYVYNHEVNYICEVLGLSPYKYHKILESAIIKVNDYIDYYGYNCSKLH